jgi:hypothetical protein
LTATNAPNNRSGARAKGRSRRRTASMASVRPRGGNALR